MQYVRSISGSVSKTWNSINPATLSGAIDVIVIELEDGTLACSPFHVRFGKFSLLRPYEKKVEFRVNNVKQDYAMKLGEEGEAFFVFETSTHVPLGLQTSPLVSPVASPGLSADGSGSFGDGAADVDFLDLGAVGAVDKGRRGAESTVSPLSISSDDTARRPSVAELADLHDRYSESMLPSDARIDRTRKEMLRSTRSLTPLLPSLPIQSDTGRDRSRSPPPLPTKEAIERAAVLSEKLSLSNIRSQITDTGDLMLDMTGYKSSDDEALRAEVIARKILSEELAGNYDIGALIGVDEQGRTWIYSSEEAKEEAAKRAGLSTPFLTLDASSDPGYHSDGDSDMLKTPRVPTHHRSGSDVSTAFGLDTPPDATKNFAKTLRLTSDQLKALQLKPGPNAMSFTVNRAVCSAYMYLWRYDVPIVISDIDGTITKSDALGHVLNYIGRDWTHIGVAKLYTEIVSNGYNIMYLTSRSVGQADTTRGYLNSVVQEGYRLPKGPTIMSPDRTIAALRRELYIRKPEVFKMACLRDIKNLFGPGRNPFYGGFGNRYTDALSYRSVSIPQNRIFTINSYAEVSLDLLSLNKRYSYVDMREVVDHYFPPVTMRVQGGCEDFTDYMYWREPVLDLDAFSDSGDDGLPSSPSHSQEGGADSEEGGADSEGEDDDEEGDEDDEGLGDSYISRESMDETMTNSILSAVEDSVREDPLAEYVEAIEEADGEEESMNVIIADEDATPGVDAPQDAPILGHAQEQAQAQAQLQTPSTEQRRRSSAAVEDIDAQVITGMQGLSMESMEGR